MVNQPKRYYRRVTETVLRWYTELDDGMIQSESGPVFDTRVLDYRIDVSKVLAQFTETEQAIVLLIHRDGCSPKIATAMSGVIVERPELYVEDIEVRMGRAFDKRKLGQFLAYVGYLR